MFEAGQEEAFQGFEIAEANASQSRADQKEHYDWKIQGAFLTVGDRALVRDVSFQGTHKIVDHWSEEVYLVVKQPKTIPVYEIEPESGNGKSKVLHHNLLLQLLKPHAGVSDQDVGTVTQREGTDSDNDSDDDLFYLFGVLCRFQHYTGHITTGSWKGRGNQYIQFVRVLYCKLPTNGKQLPAFPLVTMRGSNPGLRGGR